MFLCTVFSAVTGVLLTWVNSHSLQEQGTLLELCIGNTSEILKGGGESGDIKKHPHIHVYLHKARKERCFYTTGSYLKAALGNLIILQSTHS